MILTSSPARWGCTLRCRAALACRFRAWRSTKARLFLNPNYSAFKTCSWKSKGAGRCPSTPESHGQGCERAFKLLGVVRCRKCEKDWKRKTGSPVSSRESTCHKPNKKSRRSWPDEKLLNEMAVKNLRPGTGPTWASIWVNIPMLARVGGTEFLCAWDRPHFLVWVTKPEKDKHAMVNIVR